MSEMTLEYFEQNLRLAFVLFSHFPAPKIYVLLHVGKCNKSS